MATELDALQLNITSSTSTAITSINNLIGSLQKLGDRMGMFNKTSDYATNIGNMAKSIETLSSSINNIDSGKFKQLSSSIRSFVKASESLSNFKGFNAVQSGADGVSAAIRKVADDFANEWGISGKNATEKLTSAVENMYNSFDDITALNNAFVSVQKLVQEFADLSSQIGETNSQWQEVRKWISSSNIALPDMTGEWGDDYKRKRGILGISNTSTSTSRQGDFTEQVAQMNSALGTTFDVTKSEQDLLNDVVDYIERGRDKASELARSFWESKTNADMLKDSIYSLMDNLGQVEKNAESLNANFSNIQSSPLENITSGLESISGITLPDFSSMTVLASAITRIGGDSGTRATQNLIPIAEGLKAFQGINIPQLQGIQDFANGLRSLGSKNIVSASMVLRPLGNALRDFPKSITVPAGIEQLAELGRSLSVFGRKTSVQAAQVLPSLTKGLRELFTTLATVPSVSQNVVDLTNALAQFVSNVNRVGTSSNKASKGLRFFGNTASSVSKKTFSLAAAIGKIYATYFLLFRLFGKIRDAIDISSDLKEVENVVNTTFGSMTDKVNEFAQTSIKNFGMSELSAKQYASRFQAMGVAMAIPAQSIAKAQQQLNAINPALASRGYSDTADSIADMSINLTKLTGDMASFYNVAQEDVAEDLESIFTGQTRNLRKFGLDLTEATLSEWAMKNGLDSNIKSMTQAEKTMLRYQYVMANTSAVQGDFSKTSLTWANQVRILGQNFQRLDAVIGSGFIAWLRPMIVQVNAAMDSIIAAVQKTVNALGKIFGWQMIVDTTGNQLIDDTEGVADAWDDATGAAKKYAKQLLGIDELNNLTTQDKSGSGADSGIGGGLSGGNIIEPGGIKFEKFESDIDNLFDLGKTISDKLRDMLASIDWNSIYEKAKNFGKGLADFLNGLIQPETFYQIGKTISNFLNTAIYSSLTFAKEFDWRNLGISLANSVNGFFKNFNFASLAESINKWVHGIWEMMKSFVKNVNWGDVFGGIVDFFKNLNLDTVVLLSIGTLPKLFKTAFGVKVIAGIKNTYTALDVFTTSTIASKSALTGLTTAFPKLLKPVQKVQRAILQYNLGMRTGVGRVQSFNGAISELTSGMSTFAKGLTVAVAGFVEFSLVSDSVRNISTGVGSLTRNIAKLSAGVVAAGTAMTLVLGFPAGVVAAGVIGLIGAIKGLYDGMKKIESARFGESIRKAFTDNGGVPLEKLVESVSDKISSMGTGFKLISEKTNNLETAKRNVSDIVFEIGKIKTEMDAGVVSVEEGTQKLDDAFGRLEEAVKTKLGGSVDVLIATFGTNGFISQAYGYTEEKSEEFTKHIIENTTEQEKRISEIRSKLAESQYGSTEWNDLYQQYISLANGADQLIVSLDDLSSYVDGKLNWSHYYNRETGQLESEKVIDSISEVFSEAQNFQSAFEEAVESAKQAAVDANDQETLDMIRNGYPDALQYAKNRSAEEIKSLTDTIQNSLVDELETIIQDAENDWNKMPWYEKILHPEGMDSYISQRVQTFKEETIDPISEEIEKGFEEMGVDSKSWIDDFYGELYTEVTEHDKSFSEAFKIANEETGRNLTKGIAKGAEEEATSSDTQKAMDGVEKGIVIATHKSFEIHSPARVMYPIGENIILGIFEGFKLVDFSQKMSEWFKGNVNPWFSQDKWNFTGISDGLSSAWNSAIESIKKLWIGFVDWFNKNLEIKIDTSNPIGEGIKELLGSDKITLGQIAKYQYGGFPNQGSLFVAGETYGQSEWVGNVNGKTGVVSGYEITGIADAIYQTSSQEMAMLRQQNEYLYGILNKNFGITRSEISKAVQSYGARETKRTQNQTYLFNN